jgi:hypothetical protein
MVAITKEKKKHSFSKGVNLPNKRTKSNYLHCRLVSELTINLVMYEFHSCWKSCLN